MMPSRLIKPTVGLIPTRPFAVPGLRIDPDVSVPMPTVARFAATAMPGPELDPPGVSTGRPSFRGRPSASTAVGPVRGSGRGSYGLYPYPASELYPAGMPLVRKLANSVIVALPMMIAPAASSFRVTNASDCGTDPANATDPAVVGMSFVSTLSLRITGIPNSGRFWRPFARPPLPWRASFTARGFTYMYELRWVAVLLPSYAAIRARYICTSWSAVMMSSWMAD